MFSRIIYLIFCTVTSSVFAELKPQLKIGTLLKVDNCERRSQNGDTLHMHYRGTLQSTGSEFDSSYNRNTLFTFTLGQGRVIKGWEQGLQNMCPGEKRRLTIPAHLGYGDSGSRSGKVPPGATMIFEVVLAKLEKEGQVWESEIDESDKKEL